MKGNNFNENTRVQVPAALHLCRLGYTYLDDIPEYDKRTNIITPIFKQSIKKLNPTMTELEILQLLERIVSEAKNDNLGREFYEMLSSNSGVKLRLIFLQNRNQMRSISRHSDAFDLHYL